MVPKPSAGVDGVSEAKFGSSGPSLSSTYVVVYRDTHTCTAIPGSQAIVLDRPAKGAIRGIEETGPDPTWIEAQKVIVC